MSLSDGPLVKKLNLWRSGTKGFKSRLSNKAKSPVMKRDDIDDVISNQAVRKGDRLQATRLRHYPSIDVEHSRLFAGRIEGSISEAEDKLVKIGARNNPTAYVEVSDEHGPDSGSYSILHITETGGRLDLPRARNSPSFLRRVKDQIHIVLWDTSDSVEFGAHREQHAWLQPARHVLVNDSDARVGVRDFRDIWYDEFGEELDGKSEVKYDTTH